MRELKDWCISRQLWWGHKSPCGIVNAEKRLRVRAITPPALNAMHSLQSKMKMCLILGLARGFGHLAHLAGAISKIAKI